MTIYHTKYGGIIHNPEAYLKLGGDIYKDKHGYSKKKKYIKKCKIEESKSKINIYIIDKANLFELQKYKRDLAFGYSYNYSRFR